MPVLILISILFYIFILILVRKAEYPTRSIGPFLVISSLLATGILIYINRTFVDAVFLDGFIPVANVERFLTGQMTLAELFEPKGEHILAGYTLLYVLNAYFLNLDMRLEPIVYLLSFVALSGITYLTASRLFRSRSDWSMLLMFLPLGLISYSLVAPPLFFMSTQFTWATTIAAMVGWFYQQDVDIKEKGTPKLWPKLGSVGLILIYYFGFSGAYFPGLIFGIGGMIVVRLFVKREKPGAHEALIVAVGAVCSAWYFYKSFVVQTWPESVTFGQRATNLLRTPVDTLLTYFAGFGASVMDSHTVENNPQLLLILGGVMSAITLFAIWAYFKFAAHKHSYMPIFLIGYTVGIISVVRLGRNQQGDWGWIANEWYAFHLRPLCLGVALILIYTLHTIYADTWPKRLTRWSSSICIASLLFILGSHLVANHHQWRRGQGIRNWATLKQMALLFPNHVDQKELLWSPEGIEASRQTLQRYHLSVYSERSRNEIFYGAPNGLISLKDWYSDGWVGGDGAAAFWADQAGSITVSGTIPDYIASSKVEIILNDKPLFAGDALNAIIVTGHGISQPGINILRIKATPAISPAERGINGDQRTLAFHIKTFSRTAAPSF